MKQKNYFLSAFLLILVWVPCSAQFPAGAQNRSTSFNFEGNLAANNLMRSRDVLREVLYQGRGEKINLGAIEGEPYFDEVFLNAKLMYKDSAKIGDYMMRYHAYADEMEVSNSEGGGFLNKADYLRIHLKDDIYRPLNYTADDGNIKKGFFIEKATGENASLFLRKYKTLKDGEQAKTSFHKNKPPMFVDHENYFLKFGSAEPIEIKLKKNKVLNSFPEHTAALKKYVSDQDLDLDTEAGVVQLVKYYNTL